MTNDEITEDLFHQSQNKKIGNSFNFQSVGNKDRNR